MNINPKNGVGELLFGMQQQHVVAVYGKPSKQFKDEDQNVVYLYNQHKMRLTFYDDEEFRLGYIVVSDPETTLFDKKVIGRNPKEIQGELPQKAYKTWEVVEEDGVVSYFNEDNWLMLIAEFDEIVKVEVGAIFNNNDEFDWKFSG
ncbi:hypothetical protein FEDK69T_19780 [Flavobacterium enshiense DK69]|uniref:Uncharacterized protein n=1 Tax=Flavobacterium enshiense DK69 TaxID=1107311 RepID=V6S7R2_9FLAO|nr:hypothetical protein [Flavobacterium enshiense]ESU22718.1 hypothetical protein FEDK69T_19780 [Flavobacterium enshiense DK69]KGO95586.1 hypothetical protein Q767_10170 [Flavobacterium enshiense DK69]